MGSAVGVLRSLGIGPSDRVAVPPPPGLETVVTTLAVACGAAAVPLGDAYTLAEYERCLRLLGVMAALVTAGNSTV